MVLMKKEKLKKLLTKVFLKYKLSKAHAKICSDALVNAELVGATGHGVSRLKMSVSYTHLTLPTNLCV